MAEMTYQNVEDTSGERIATNAYYTGHKLGTPTQDAATGADNNPYVTERNAVHCGTIAQDSADENFPQAVVEESSSGSGGGSGSGTNESSGTSDSGSESGDSGTTESSGTSEGGESGDSGTTENDGESGGT